MTDRLKERLKELSELTDGWAGKEVLAVKPSERALKNTEEIVNYLGSDIEAVTAIFPMHSGNVCIQGNTQRGRYMIMVYHERYEVIDSYKDFMFLMNYDNEKTKLTDNITEEKLKEIKEEITKILL